MLSHLAPPIPPFRGVKKFKTIEEANADTEARIAEQVRAGRARVVR